MSIIFEVVLFSNSEVDFIIEILEPGFQGFYWGILALSFFSLEEPLLFSDAVLPRVGPQQGARLFLFRSYKVVIYTILFHFAKAIRKKVPYVPRDFS